LRDNELGSESKPMFVSIWIGERPVRMGGLPYYSVQGNYFWMRKLVKK